MEEQQKGGGNGLVNLGLIVLFVASLINQNLGILFMIVVVAWGGYLMLQGPLTKVTGTFKGKRPLGPPPNERVRSIPVPTPVEAAATPLVEMPGELPRTQDNTTGKNIPLSKNWINAIVQEAVHILIIGETNSGKSTAAKAILKQRASNGEKIIILDPHARPSTWNGLEAVGRGRDYAAIEQMITILQNELQERYKQYAEDDNYNPTRLNIFVDEVPSIVSYCDSWQDFFTVLSCEARKVNMSLICLSQSRLVDMLGIKGRSDVRENFTELLLGDKAIKVIKDLAGTNRPAVLDHKGRVTAVDVSPLPGLGTGEINAGVLWVPDVNIVAQKPVQTATGVSTGTFPSISLTASLTEEEMIKVNDWEDQGMSRRAITRQLYRLRGGQDGNFSGDGPLFQIVKQYLDNLP